MNKKETKLHPIISITIPVLVLLLFVPVPAIVLHVLLFLELAECIILAVYVSKSSCRLLPVFVTHLALLIMAFNISLIRFSLTGLLKNPGIPSIPFLSKPDPVYCIMIVMAVIVVPLITFLWVRKNVNHLEKKEAESTEGGTKENADLYSSMTGAVKLLYGTLKCALWLVLVNLVGGTLISHFRMGLTWPVSIEAGTFSSFKNVLFIILPIPTAFLVIKIWMDKKTKPST